jgi:hypothetical protein
MNTPELFMIGAIVTAIVSTALGLVLYGAVLDGRDARRAKRQEAAGRTEETDRAPSAR